MKRPSTSDSYDTDYLSWPDQISRRCDICGSILEFAHPDNGKLVHTLDGDIHQVMYKYTCPNVKCENFKHYLNPAPRYDYDKKYFGKDVLRRIAREIFIFHQNPEQIHLRLTLDYELNIGLRTVQRMYNDCILVKSHKIDEQTKVDLSENKGIIMAADAQDPGAGMEAIWLFTDCLSSRLLNTQQTKSMPSEKLQGEIKKILANYSTKLLGFVSDKQNSIVKCMREYFPDVPHQYCTWHFTGHLWNHLEVFDSQIFSELKTGIIKLPIHSRSSTSKTNFEGYGKLSLREVFSEIDKDLQRLLKIRSKKFQALKGLALYRSLKRFVKDLEDSIRQIDLETKFGIHYLRTLERLQALLESVQERFFEILFMYDTFKVIYSLLYIPNLKKADRQQQLDHVFGKCWAVARIKAPTMTMESLRAFNPKASSTCPVILGEWVRLWNSYLPGLFQYYAFSITRRTNIAQEQAFSVEKTALNRRMANSEVGVLQELQGEFYLRFCHCTQKELRNDIVKEYMDVEVGTLRDAYHNKVKNIASNWFYRAEPLKGIKITLEKYKTSKPIHRVSKTKKLKQRSYHKIAKKKLNKQNINEKAPKS